MFIQYQHCNCALARIGIDTFHGLTRCDRRALPNYVWLKIAAVVATCCLNSLDKNKHSLHRPSVLVLNFGCLRCCLWNIQLGHWAHCQSGSGCVLNACRDYEGLSQHCSHFGSMYKLGCCGHACLFRALGRERFLTAISFSECPCDSSPALALPTWKENHKCETGILIWMRA